MWEPPISLPTPEPAPSWTRERGRDGGREREGRMIDGGRGGGGAME